MRYSTLLLKFVRLRLCRSRAVKLKQRGEKWYHAMMTLFTRTPLVFVAAFVLNFLWEHAHSVLYISYQSGAITNILLLRAAAFDAAAIALFSYPFLQFESLRQKRGILYVLLVVFAVTLEKWALATSRWVYTDIMPLVPILHVGLTPTIQLGILGYLTLWISDYFCNKKTDPRESVSGTL